MTNDRRQSSCRIRTAAESNNRYIMDFTGYSMFPALRPGDRLVVNSLPAKDVETGDILITRNNGKPPAAHRLVKRLSATSGLTKGDAMPPQIREQVKFTGAVERVEAVIRGKRIIVLSSGFRGATKRWQAFFSRHGWTSGAIREAMRRRVRIRRGRRRTAALRRSDIFRWLCHLPKQRFDTEQLKLRLPFLQSEGMAGVAYRALGDRQIEAGVRQRLSGTYHWAVKQNLIHLDFIKRLEHQLSGTAVDVMVIKGGALLHHVYPHVGARPMEDVDLLVRPSRYRQLADQLEKMGFRQNPLRTYSFVNSRMRLDIHTDMLNTDRIASRSGLLPAGMQPIWRNALPWDNGYRRVRRPDDVDHILILCQHLLKHYFCRLIWFEDLRRLLDGRNEQFFLRLRNRAAELKQEKPLAYCMYLLRHLIGSSLPLSSALKALCPQPGAGERLLLRLALIDQNMALLAPILTACCIAGPRQRLVFLHESLFLRREVMAVESGAGRSGWRTVHLFSRILLAAGLVMRHLSVIGETMLNRRRKPHMARNHSGAELQ